VSRLQGRPRLMAQNIRREPVFLLGDAGCARTQSPPVPARKSTRIPWPLSDRLTRYNLTPKPPDTTLSPPLALRDSAHILRDIIAVYETSLVDEADREQGFGLILRKAVDPAVEMCERMAEMKVQPTGQGEAGKGEWERDIFLINCLNYLLVSAARVFSEDPG
jgi:hypothetical protein